MFRRATGKTKLMYFKKQDTAVADVIMEGGLVGLNDSGKLQYCGNDSTDRVIGVAKMSVSAIDTSSWNTAPWLPVEVPVESGVEWDIDTDSDGGAADSDVGRYVAVDTATASDCAATRVDISDTANPQVFITKVISATKVRGVLSKTAFVRTFDSLDTTG